MAVSFSGSSYVGDEQTLKKRKRISHSRASSSDDLDNEKQQSNVDVECRRQIHSKIEKRRRDKMNNYITQLAAMIPMQGLSSQKLDKITALRLAVKYLKSIRVSPMQVLSEENLKYSFISESEHRKLILQVTEGFLFVVNCESATIQYVSQSASKIFKCNYTDLPGRSLYDVIHPQDVDKVKEQISCVKLNPKQQLMGSKPSEVLKLEIPNEQLGMHSGLRRSFFIRVKTDIEEAEKLSLDTGKYSLLSYNNSSDELVLMNDNFNEHNRYTIIQCIGYLKCWNPKHSQVKIVDDIEDGTSPTYLVAIGRALDDVERIREADRPVTFISKHSMDGKFIFIDHWATTVTGYLPQEMLGTNIYDYIHTEDVNLFVATHQSILQYPNNTVISNIYRFRTKFGNFINVQSEWKSLLNPWKKEIEYCFSKNTVNRVQETKLNVEKMIAATDLVQNNQFVPVEKSEEDLVMEFNLQPSMDEKHDTVASIEAILKLLECEANIAD